MTTTQIFPVAALLALPQLRTPVATPCLLCGTAVAPGPRWPFRFAGLDVAYCDECDERESTDHKLLAIARALDDRLIAASVD